MLFIYGLFTAFLLGIPFLNHQVFHTVNLEEVKREARVHVDSINSLKDDGQYTAMREYCLKVDSLYSGRKDAPSIFLCQLALFDAGLSHQLAGEWEEAVDAYENMLKRYPQTVFAEQIFFICGQSLMQAKNYPDAIKWFERLEMNRDLSQAFPKYRHRELHPGRYVNLDEVGKDRETYNRYYTNEIRKREANKVRKDEGGNLFSDAVVKVGECYLAMQKSDSARQQLRLIPEYFPDSDKLPEVQLLIADSYFNDGERMAQEADALAEGPERQELARKARYQYQAAEREYYKFVNRYPDHELATRAYIQLGAIRFAAGDEAGARKIFRDAIAAVRVADRQAQIQFEVANYYYNRKRDLPKALEAYDKVVIDYPEHKLAGNAQFLEGVIHEEMRDSAQAMEAFQKVADNYRSSAFFAEAAYRLARKRLDAKDYQGAEKYFNQIVVTSPGSPVAARSWLEMGLINIERKEWLEAIRKLEYAVGGGVPAIADQASLKIAECWKQLGDQAKADEYLGKIKDETIRDELYWEESGGKDAPAKKLEKIAANLRARKDPKERMFWFEQAANVHIDLGAMDSALADLDSALALNQDKLKRVALGLTRGQLLASPQLKRYGESRQYLSGLLEISGLRALQRAKLQYEIYEDYRKEGQDAQALAGYQEVVKAFSGSSDEKERQLAANAQFNLARMREAEKKPDTAYAEYAKFIKLFPNNEQLPEAVFGAGQALADQGEPRKGAEYIEARLAEFQSKDAIAHAPQKINQRLGEFYSSKLAKKGDAPAFAKAEGYFRKAMAGDSTSPYFAAAAYGLGALYGKWGEADGKDYSQKAQEAFAAVPKDQESYYKASRNELAKLLAKKDWKQAVRTLEEAAQQSTKDYQAFKAKESKAEADAALREAMVATMSIANIYSERKMYLEAAQKFDEAYQFRSGDSTLRSGALIQAISNYNNAGRGEEVRALADRMAKDFPSSPYTANGLYLKANTWYEQGVKHLDKEAVAARDLQSAYRAFDDIIRFLGAKPKLSEGEEAILQVAYYLKGDCMLFSKKYEQARRDYERSVEKFPKGTYRCTALHQVGNTYFQEQKWDLAAKKFEQVRGACEEKSFPLYCANLGRLGQSLERDEKRPQAMKVYKDCLGRCREKDKDEKFCRDRLEEMKVNN